MKKIYILASLMILMSFAFAQQQNVSIYLKNGSIIKGKVVESWTPENIKIKSNNIIWTFHESEVDTVLTGRTKKVQPKIEMPYHFRVEYGVLSGNSENTENGVSYFHSTFNYGLNENTFAGLGSGVEYYFQQSYIPALANFEYKLRPTRFSPYLFVKTGYLIPGEKQHHSSNYSNTDPRHLPPNYLHAKGGAIINPGFGFTSMLGKNFGFGLAAGYRYHVLHFNGKDQYELEYHLHRLSISLSITFK